ncbi:uncharacterized protein LOC114247711 [Bombyx mandarina]|uniref:Uncharacterized protein LOC114247711 n=1 Tax=Bombyx mandarina TaxID=7092 RepID=A0A6J2K4K4_BOMMA|nr:uncharacterized protein LOC114247711 [Bombyx mandarina]
MKLSPEEFVNQLLTKEASEQPSDDVKPEELVMELPEWFDEKQFNQARKFYDENSYSFSSSMLQGLVAVLSVPSILRVLVGTRRSSSVFTAYKRYLSTLLHTISWFEHELKPGSMSWRSLYAVRSRHVKASLASNAKGTGVVSQRDIALTQFGFIGFSVLKPDFFGIRQLGDGDWQAYNHFWRVIGYMIGLDDRYNICRETIEETREVCQLLLNRVYTPCLENAPEYFEHMARVMLDGMWCINPTVDLEANMYGCRYLADVPGYIYTERDRIELQQKLRKHLKGKSLDTGVDSSLLMSQPAVDGLPERAPRLLYYNDYNTIETAPAYKQLGLKSKYKLACFNIYMCLYTTFIGRWYFNANFKFSLFLMRYFPYFPFLAFFRFGVRNSYVNIFVEDLTSDTKPKINSEYYKPQEPTPWYRTVLELLF